MKTASFTFAWLNLPSRTDAKTSTNGYIGSLKRLTNHQDPDGFIRVMSRAQYYAQQIDFTDLEAARRTLASQNAFEEPGEDVKLQFPN